jgi:hypothetical protein
MDSAFGFVKPMAGPITVKCVIAREAAVRYTRVSTSITYCQDIFHDFNGFFFVDGVVVTQIHRN